MNIADYFVKIKCITEALTSIRKLVELNDFVMYVLTGLLNYESLITIVLARGGKITLDLLYSLLLSYENRIE